jgi:carbamoyltransferase
MTSKRFHDLFGAPPRPAESPVRPLDWDIAASIQSVTETIMLRMAEHAHRVTGLKNLCLAGGVALNCVGNGRILREGPFENLWIQPAAGDAGGALGVATFIWHQLLGNARTPEPADSQVGSLLGPGYTSESVRSFLDSKGARYRRIEDEDALVAHVAGLIANGKVIGWVQGRMEFGPRALGGRSIIGDARSEAMQSVMNLKIKFRESFRPFAPSVLKESVSEWFEMRPDEDSPYMLVPAITHVDYSARVQTVDAKRHGRYYKLLRAFEKNTGCPVVINTSFNVRGEPIVLSPEHAYRCFLGTNMDVLVLEDCVLLKEEQPGAKEIDNAEYLKQFALD